MNKKIAVIVGALILTVTALLSLSEAFNLPDTGQAEKSLSLSIRGASCKGLYSSFPRSLSGIQSFKHFDV